MNINAETTGCKCGCNASTEEAELYLRLEEVLKEYAGKPGALIPVLQCAQAIFGYLPEGVIKKISEGLGKSYSEVSGVISFYSFFSTVPKGKYQIRVCMGTACYVRGGKTVLDTLKKDLKVEVGGTTADRMFSLSVVRCIGACGLAPAIMVGNNVHERVKPSKLKDLLASYANAA